MTEIFLAAPQSSVVDVLDAWDWHRRPLNLLASFAYKDHCAAAQRYAGRAGLLMLDSGAFTAYHQGTAIDIEALSAEARSGRWDICVALDVIGDGAASFENTLWMSEQGIKVLPVYHFEDPWEYLEEYARRFEYIGLACTGRPKIAALRWLEQCFARAWPRRFHSFGRVERPLLERFPFATADAASWVLGPLRFSSSVYHTEARSKNMVIRGRVAKAPLVRQWMEYYWRLQQDMRARWRADLLRIGGPSKCRHVVM